MVVAEASQEAFHSQVLSLKEVYTAQQDEIKSLRAELTEAKDAYGRLVVDSTTEKAALQIRVLDLEVGSRFPLVSESTVLTGRPCEQAQRTELKETVVEQQIKISKFERHLPDDIPPVISTRRSPSPPAWSRGPLTLSPATPRSPISSLQTPSPRGGETAPSSPSVGLVAGGSGNGTTYVPPFPSHHGKTKPHPVSQIQLPTTGPRPGSGNPRQPPSEPNVGGWLKSFTDNI